MRSLFPLRTSLLAALLTAGAAGTAFVIAGCSNPGSTTGVTTGTATTASSDCSAVTGTTAKSVCLANAFLATLSTSQQSSVVLALNATNWAKWSNLPVGAASRNGLAFGSLTAAQQTAALALAQAALSAQGYTTFSALRVADEYLKNSGGGSAYGSGLYYVAFLGTPSATERWMLQLGGHHYLASAKLGTSFSDVLLGPGQDGKFPTSQGLVGSQLTSAQLALVKTAIEQWVNDLPAAEAAPLLVLYEDATALSNTYVAWSGASTPTVQGSYVRIDGPRVWIEFVCQNGIVIQGQIHYHTIWRDRTSDYGGSLSTSSVRSPSTTLEHWLASPHYTTPAGPLTVVRSYASR